MHTDVSDGPVIECRKVCVAYGRQEVLHNVDLAICRGSFAAFVGPNGAGKTTLLRVILGLLPVRKGVLVTPFHQSPPGYVPQHRSIDPLFPVSVRQIVSMGLYPQLGWWRRPRAEHRLAVEGALERFGLAGHGSKTYRELSGGMKQKALLARAFVSKAEVFIMDEPTSELDEASEREVIDHLHDLSQREGKTVLLAHHGVGHISSRATVTAVVEHGRVSMQEGAARA